MTSASGTDKGERGSSHGVAAEAERLPPAPQGPRRPKRNLIAEVGSGMTPPPLVIRGVLAGIIAALTFRHAALLVLSVAGLVPPPSFSLKPAPSLTVPAIALVALWGGFWGAILALLLARFRRERRYWHMAFLYGAVLLTFPSVAIVLVAQGRSALGLLWLELIMGLIVNGVWGLGTALLLIVL